LTINEILNTTRNNGRRKEEKVEVGYGEKAVGRGEDLLVGEGEPQPTKLTACSNFS
jgi:hypothetical protein